MADLNYVGIVLPDGNSYQTAGEYVPYSSTVSTPISDVSVQNLAPEYDPTLTYNIKDWCVYNGVLYQCNTAISTPEAFDSTKWTAKKIVDMTGSDIAVSDSDATSIAEAINALNEITTGQATLDTTKIDGGGISYNQIGKLVIVDVNVRFKANVATDSAICSGLPSGSFVHFLIGVSQNIYRAYFDGTTIKMSDVPPAAYCTGMFVYKAT